MIPLAFESPERARVGHGRTCDVVEVLVIGLADLEGAATYIVQGLLQMCKEVKVRW